MIYNLKSLREEKGLSQQKLAEKFNLSQQSIHKYETQDVEPDIDTLKAMASFFETSIDYLVGYTNIRRKTEKVENVDLNEEEVKHIEAFRRLSPDIRVTIDTLIQHFFNE